MTTSKSCGSKQSYHAVHKPHTCGHAALDAVGPRANETEISAVYGPKMLR